MHGGGRGKRAADAIGTAATLVATTETAAAGTSVGGGSVGVGAGVRGKRAADAKGTAATLGAASEKAAAGTSSWGGSVGGGGGVRGKRAADAKGTAATLGTVSTVGGNDQTVLVRKGAGQRRPPAPPGVPLPAPLDEELQFCRFCGRVTSPAPRGGVKEAECPLDVVNDAVLETAAFPPRRLRLLRRAELRLRRFVVLVLPLLPSPPPSLGHGECVAMLGPTT